MLLGMAVTASAARYPDTEGHWGEAAIEKWSEYEVLQGVGDGTFAPDEYMTSEQLATVLVKAFGYTEKYEGELPGYESTWGEDAVRQAVAAGALEASEASAELTRELAAKVISKALHIAPVSGETKFADDYAIGVRYKPYVNALGKLGIFNGDTGGNFAPASLLTRAQVMQVLDNTIGDIVKESVSGEYDKSVIVNAGGVTLSESVIDGDVVIAQGVGDGDVTLDSVTVTGRLVVFGGGSSSVRIKGKSEVPVVVIDKTFGQPARLSVESADASVGTVRVDAESKAIVATEGGAKIGAVETVSAVAVNEDGEIAAVTPEVKTELTIAATVTTVTIDSGNAEVTVASGAAIESLAVAGDGAAVTVATGATVKEAVVSASDVSIGGAGKVESVTVTEESQGGVTITASTTVKNESDASVDAGGGKTVEPGKEGTASSGSGSGSSSTGGGGTGTYYPITSTKFALSAKSDDLPNTSEIAANVQQTAASAYKITLTGTLDAQVLGDTVKEGNFKNNYIYDGATVNTGKTGYFGFVTLDGFLPAATATTLVISDPAFAALYKSDALADANEEANPKAYYDADGNRHRIFFEGDLTKADTMSFLLWSGAESKTVTVAVTHGSSTPITVTIDYSALDYSYTADKDITVANSETLEIPANSSVVIPSGKTLTVASGGTLNVNGTLEVSGTLTVSGALVMGGTLVAKGTPTLKIGETARLESSAAVNLDLTGFNITEFKLNGTNDGKGDDEGHKTGLRLTKGSTITLTGAQMYTWTLFGGAGTAATDEATVTQFNAWFKEDSVNAERRVLLDLTPGEDGDPTGTITAVTSVVVDVTMAKENEITGTKGATIAPAQGVTAGTSGAYVITDVSTGITGNYYVTVTSSSSSSQGS
jgi:hypothetical protein